MFCGTEATVEYISGVIHGYKEGSFHTRRPMDYRHDLLENIHPFKFFIAEGT